MAGETVQEHEEDPPAERSAMAGAGQEPASPGIPRIPLLCGVFFVCLGLYLRLVPNDPAIRTMLARRMEISGQPDGAYLRSLRAKDPPIGSVLPVPGARAGQSSVPQRTLVVMLGSCSECGLRHLLAVQELADATPGMAAIVVSPTADVALQSFRKEHGLHLRMVSDPGEALSRRYNAAWSPRAYVLSKTGALLWAQPTPQMGLQVPKQMMQGGGR